MEAWGYALLGLALGAAVGAIAMTLRREHGGSTERLEVRLAVQEAELRRLADGSVAQGGAAGQLREEVAGARRVLERLAVHEEQRLERDHDNWTVIQRLQTVLAGGSSKGRAGENVLREHLGELPPTMLVTDFRVNGKVVEFGLLLPDGRRLPIDSKWSALAELEALEAADDSAERELRGREVEKVVARRAAEVAQYLDPALTAPVAVAAVPDAAYAVLRRAHADAFAKGVVIVPYSTALPVVLFLYGLVGRYGDAGDVQGCLSEIASALVAMETTLENKVVKAATMLSNGADEFRAQLGKARGSVARGRSTLAEPDAPRPLGGAEPRLEAVP
jgi:hypothetical protein